MIRRVPIVLAAGQVVNNAVADTSMQFAPEDSLLTIAAATTAAGVTISARLTDEVILDEGSEVPVTANGNPVVPDEVVVPRQPMARGDQLIVRLQNTTAGALTAILLIDRAAI